MRVYGDSRDFESMSSYDVGGFSPDTGEAREVFDRRRYFTFEFFHQPLRAMLE